MIVGKSRRAIAKTLGHPDTSAGIPEARWMRAMTFERLVRDEKFVSKLLTTTVGALGLRRPKAVRRADAAVSVDRTAVALQQAHLKAVHEQTATMLTSLAVPFVGMEAEPSATPVKPDFAIIAPRFAPNVGSPVGSWLVMGDAKDYERVRSRIDDGRMLKGFLQVALGAESAAAWSKVPAAMEVHRSGALAVPRNAFLQPEAIVELLDDHRREVRSRVDERTALLSDDAASELGDTELAELVEHLEAVFDPASCSSCALFNYCRSELRRSADPAAVLIEIGIRPEDRPGLAPILAGGAPGAGVSETLAASVRATATGGAQFTGQRRIDPAGLAGTIDVVVAKSDAAALGLLGIGVRRVRLDGSTSAWEYTTFGNAQAPGTRVAAMEILGRQLSVAMDELCAAEPNDPDPVHLVLPDLPTGDLLVSIADSIAGVETSRLRWARDIAQNRKPLTFDGEPATVPAPLSSDARLAVSFLLEEDRARAMTLRSPMIDLRRVMARHLVPGGPLPDAGRLDYLVTWGESTGGLDHRAVSDRIADSKHTPGARLANDTSDAIHRTSSGGRKSGDPVRYAALIRAELEYKAAIVERALATLRAQPESNLRPVYRSLEAAAQEVWRDRLRLRASDLVRFGRTTEWWRNNQVDMLETDTKCADQLAALSNPHVALDMANNAGTRMVTCAEVVEVTPLRLRLGSRQFVNGTAAVALQVNDEPTSERSTTAIKIQKGSFKFGNLPLGPLSADANTAADGCLTWTPRVAVNLAAGDRIVLAHAAWFGKVLTSGHEINVDRPARDITSAPKATCYDGAYASDPANHRWCCRPHEDAEAEWADHLAGRRQRGELNPETWPPIIDDDAFDTAAVGSPTAQDAEPADESLVPSHLTIDDLD